MFKLYCRCYQFILNIVASFLSWRKPTIIHSLLKLPKLIKHMDINKVLIVTDKEIMKLSLIDSLLQGLNHYKIDYVIYDKTVPNPTIDNIEEARLLYITEDCEAIISFGGGSPMDCAKIVGARIARPKKRVQKMRGLLKIRKKLPPLFAVPTTAGTGSEATLVAVITDSTTHEKYTINDNVLIPQYTVLDPLLTLNLPPHLTATTGLDALTHAIEAYLNKKNTLETKNSSQEAIKLIFTYLYEAYSNGTNLDAREKMQKAAYFAGVSFTRAYVGYVHAIAHTLGGLYSYPHGLANAIILPHVLEYYGPSIQQSLSELADLVGIGLSFDTPKQKADKFIDAIKKLNTKMNIPEKVDCIVEKDIPIIVKRAFKEANPLYPVPKILSKKDLLQIINLIKE